MSTFDPANLLDASGNAHHLTLGGQGVPMVVADPWGIGQAGLHFDGRQSAVAPVSGFVLPAEYTVDVRFARDTSHLGVGQAMCGEWGPDSNGGADYNWLLFIDADNTVSFTESSSASPILKSAAITDANPHAVRVTKSAGSISLHVDGVRVAGPTASSAAYGNPVAFRVAGDESGLPFFGTLGDIQISGIARTTASSYSVPTVPLVTDGNTRALLRLDSIHGTYLGEPIFVGTAVRRSSYAPASGGWANPDGPWQTLDGKWAFSVSAYNGTIWTIYAVIANSLAELLAGNGVVQNNAIQTPTVQEGSIAGNGTVYPWQGIYHHWYHDDGGNIKHSTGASLNAAFSAGTVIFAGSGGSANYDPWVRPSADGSTLEMFYVYQTGDFSTRVVMRSTSPDGATWSTPTTFAARQPADFPSYFGEPAAATLTGGYILSCDGASADGQPRRICRIDAATGIPLGKLLDPSGNDSGGNPYLGCYDSSPYYDAPNNRLVYLGSHSTNSQPTQPTDSDIGVWAVPLVGYLPAAPVITSPATATATVGTAFSYQITATGNPTSYAATGLPAGLSIDTTTGLISGTLQQAGTFFLSLIAVCNGADIKLMLSLVVSQPNVPNPGFGGPENYSGPFRVTNLNQLQWLSRTGWQTITSV